MFSSCCQNLSVLFHRDRWLTRNKGCLIYSLSGHSSPDTLWKELSTFCTCHTTYKRHWLVWIDSATAVNISKRCELSAHEKEMIFGNHWFGLSICNISNRFQLPLTTVSHIILKWKWECVLICQHRPSKPKKLTYWGHWCLKHAKSNCKAYIERLAEEFHLASLSDECDHTVLSDPIALSFRGQAAVHISNIALAIWAFNYSGAKNTATGL